MYLYVNLCYRKPVYVSVYLLVQFVSEHATTKATIWIDIRRNIKHLITARIDNSENTSIQSRNHNNHNVTYYIGAPSLCLKLCDVCDYRGGTFKYRLTTFETPVCTLLTSLRLGRGLWGFKREEEGCAADRGSFSGCGSSFGCFLFRQVRLKTAKILKLCER